MEVLTTKAFEECLADLLQLLPWRDTITCVERLREPLRQFKDSIGGVYKFAALKERINNGKGVSTMIS